VVKKLHDAFQAAMLDPRAMEIQKRYDYVSRYMNSADYTSFVAAQVADQKTVIEQLGLAKKTD
jgi:tripartite-type tricarboxylate transporter receptor subunit TctC